MITKTIKLTCDVSRRNRLDIFGWFSSNVGNVPNNELRTLAETTAKKWVNANQKRLSSENFNINSFKMADGKLVIELEVE